MLSLPARARSKKTTGLVGSLGRGICSAMTKFKMVDCWWLKEAICGGD